jgi:aspartyl-tRNA(Asn)/glutamyl-tRNA(Gln) amidotransferase subunit B
LPELPDGWEMVVGLEVHAELATLTKLFCGCRNAFGAEPNTNICPICLGLPGSLPVLNRRAVELVVAVGVALGSEISDCVFHRKNYFYPDMPKNYQISQYDAPICRGGRVELADGSIVRIVRAHLEEDTGKTSHVGESGRIHGAAFSLVDYNRAGVPLVEIVSEPDISSPEQAKEYVSELRGILVAIGASDGRMEEGSLRVDANVSVRRKDDRSLGTRCEIKNLNSLRSLVRALEYEAARQVDLVSSGGSVVQETRHWDEERGCTWPLRSKEEAYDYRYFPEPDLVPLRPPAEMLRAAEALLERLPASRRRRLWGLLEAEGVAGGADVRGSALADQIATVVERGLDHLVLAAAERAPARLALARVANEVSSYQDGSAKLDSQAFARLVELEASGGLGASQAKVVLARMVELGETPEEAIAALGLTNAQEEVEELVRQAVESNPAEWNRYLQGEERLAGFFVGQVMRATSGKADGKKVREVLERLRQGQAGRATLL